MDLIDGELCVFIATYFVRYSRPRFFVTGFRSYLFLVGRKCLRLVFLRSYERHEGKKNNQ